MQFWTKTETSERRAVHRAAATGGALITWKADGQPRESLGQCADLSAGGVRIVELPDSIPLATDVHISFRAIDLEADGVVVRSEGAGTIGVKFTSLTLFGSPVKRRQVPAYVRIGEILVGAALLVLLGISARSYFTGGSSWPIVMHFHPFSGTEVTGPSFNLGSSKADVQAAQGYPSAVHGNSWAYGTSTVYFVGDRVVGWKGTLDSPLKIRMEAAQPERRANEYFAIGATASEVAAIQGVPTEVRGDVWAYGPSEVYFRAGRVVGWKNSPQHPLNVHGGATPPSNSATGR